MGAGRSWASERIGRQRTPALAARANARRGWGTLRGQTRCLPSDTRTPSPPYSVKKSIVFSEFRGRLRAKLECFQSLVAKIVQIKRLAERAA